MAPQIAPAKGLDPEEGRSGVTPLVWGRPGRRRALPSFRDQRGPGFLPRRLPGYLGQQVVPTTERQGTEVGGLSSIDRVPGTDRFLCISDDHRVGRLALFYELRLDLSKFGRTPTPGHEGVEFLAVTPLRGRRRSTTRQYLVDPEGLRIDAARQRIYWSGEGIDRQVRGAQRARHWPGWAGARRWLPEASSRWQRGWHGAGDRGVRDNLGFESLTLTPDSKGLWTATEVALTQDDEPPLTTGSQARLLSFDAETGRPVRVRLHRRALPVPANLPSAFAVNGLVELLALDGQRFLALERSLFAKVA